MQAEPPVLSLLCDLLLWVIFHSCSKLQAYFDEATVSLYFAQSILVYKKKKKERDKKKPTKKTQRDDNKHKPNDSWAEEKNQ